MKTLVLLLVVGLVASIAIADTVPIFRVYITKTADSPSLWYVCLEHYYYGVIKTVGPYESKREAIDRAEIMADRWNVPLEIPH